MFFSCFSARTERSRPRSRIAAFSGCVAGLVPGVRGDAPLGGMTNETAPPLVGTGPRACPRRPSCIGMNMTDGRPRDGRRSIGRRGRREREGRARQDASRACPAPPECARREREGNSGGDQDARSPRRASMTARYAHLARDSVRETALLVSESIAADVSAKAGNRLPATGDPCADVHRFRPGRPPCAFSTRIVSP